MTEKKITRAELSRQLNISKAAITQFVKSGRLKLDIDNKITLSDAKKQLEDTAQKKSVDENNDDSLIKHKTEKEKWSAKLEELEFKKRSKELIECSLVKETAFDIAKNLKEEFLAIPERLCNIVASETDPMVIRGLMIKEFKQVLNSIADKLEDVQL